MVGGGYGLLVEVFELLRRQVAGGAILGHGSEAIGCSLGWQVHMLMVNGAVSIRGMWTT